MIKECVVLSQSYLLYYKTNLISKRYDIHMNFCKSVAEMINVYHHGTNAILIDGFNNLNDYLSKEMQSKIFYLDNDKVTNYQHEVLFNSIEEFLQSSLFTYKINKKKNYCYEEIVAKKFDEGKLIVNSWQGMFIKTLICEMKKREQIVINRQLIFMLANEYQIKSKYIYDELRPTLKEYTHILQNRFEQS